VARICAQCRQPLERGTRPDDHVCIDDDLLGYESSTEEDDG